MSEKLKQIEGRIEAIQKTVAEVFAEAGPDMDFTKVKAVEGADSDAKVAELRKLNTEAEELGVKADEIRSEIKELELMAAKAEGFAEALAHGEQGGGEGPTKGDQSLGDLFVKSDAFKAISGNQGPEATLDVDVKTLFETSAGFAPETTRTGRVVDSAQRPVQVTDFIPSVPTSQAAVVYMQESVFTNAAAETAEGGAYGEAALEYAEVSSPVRKIAVFLPVTDEQLEDEPAARARVNNRLPFMLQQRLDGQILVGNGTAPNIEGLNNRTGIQTQALGADVVLDAIFKAMTKVRTVAFAVPDLIVLNPLDWEGIRLTRTSDGVYLWGNPTEAGPERIWGTQVVQANAQTENTGLVLDTMYTELSIRRGIDVQVSNSHSDFFVNGKQAIRADMRAALQVYRPAAICEVTGI